MSPWSIPADRLTKGALAVTEVESLRLRGGATVRDRNVGRINATWPLGLLQVTPAGIQISIALTPTRWSAAWADIEAAQSTGSRVLFVSRDGSKARFITGAKNLILLRDTLAAYGVAMQQVDRASWRSV